MSHATINTLCGQLTIQLNWSLTNQTTVVAIGSAYGYGHDRGVWGQNVATPTIEFQCNVYFGGLVWRVHFLW